jgi:lipopolysaccharide transport system permease protein
MNSTLNHALEPAGDTTAKPDHRSVVVIEAGGAWSALNLRELWSYRELLFFLTWRDIKVRYKQTALGATWAILQPLLTMLIFTVIFGRFAGIPSDGIPYPIFCYTALLPWTFFSNAVTNSGNSLVGSSNLITKVYFPRMVIPGAAVLAGLVDFMIASAILAALMVYYRVAPTWQIVLFPGLVLLTAVLAFGVGMIMSALNVKYRDVRHALPFLVQIWMFATPILYPLSLVRQWRWLLYLNPLTGVIEGFRSSLLGRPFDWTALAISVLITAATLVFAAFFFRRMEKSFADIV